MFIAWAILTLLINAIWLLFVVFGLPGNWLMVLTAGTIYWMQYSNDAGAAAPMFGLTTLLVAAGLAVAGEVCEFFAGVAGAKRAGATWRGSVGAIIGGLIGGVAATFLIPIPIVGSLIGACAGAAFGAWAFEFASGRTQSEAVVAGVGAGVGRLMGTLIKLGFGVAIWILLGVAAFVA